MNRRSESPIRTGLKKAWTFEIVQPKITEVFTDWKPVGGPEPAAKIRAISGSPFLSRHSYDPWFRRIEAAPRAKVFNLEQDEEDPRITPIRASGPVHLVRT